MTKLENVIKGLECWSKMAIKCDSECSYKPNDERKKLVRECDFQKLCMDALELLKELYQAHIQELQKRIDQLEFELQQNQIWENYRNGLYNFQTYCMNSMSDIISISQKGYTK